MKRTEKTFNVQLNRWIGLVLAGLALAAGASGATPTDNAGWRRLFDSWKAPCDPVRIAGNLYYVGATGVSSYLIETREGHILLDTGFEETVGVIRTNVTRLGLRWRDIKLILASHAHLDHVGGHALLKDLTSAQIIMSAADAALLASGGKNDLGPTPSNQAMAYRAARADRIVRDGETVALGGMILTCHLTPGHTRGATTWTTEVPENGRPLKVVFFSSLSLLDGTPLLNNSNYPTLLQDYRATFAKLRALPCDIFLAPHGGMFGLADKAARLARGERPNPFIDPGALGKAVTDAEKAVEAELAKERAAGKERTASQQPVSDGLPRKSSAN
ncbi:MAG TPA: subclass B3 metallo-beta-lactamase [Verrucomicrobiae bacterium]|nr:subclass B3 metallo-beta-lactamase [Verrucomicrobiae bacterium]